MLQVVKLPGLDFQVLFLIQLDRIRNNIASSSSIRKVSSSKLFKTFLLLKDDIKQAICDGLEIDII